MKRHPALQPFSRDHNVGLVLARSLQTASDDGARREVARKLLEAWDVELKDHFSEEERLLGPLASEGMAERLRHEHRVIAEWIEAFRTTGEYGTTAAVGTLLHDHIRWEERELFPAIEASATEEDLERLARETDGLEARRHDSPLAPRRGERMDRRASQVVDLAGLARAASSSGPAWGCATDDLNGTLVRWAEGEGVAAHVNDVVDVMMVGVEGRGIVVVDGRTEAMTPGALLVIPKGAERSVAAETTPFAYLNIHLKRTLQLSGAAMRPSRR
ncbi:MAG: hemerythrin domain-containing protein [Nitrospirae bacterium]|nr:hemerythrin domain-containing protein [Fimbriimonadaceae bacterium]